MRGDDEGVPQHPTPSVTEPCSPMPLGERLKVLYITYTNNNTTSNKNKR